MSNHIIDVDEKYYESVIKFTTNIKNGKIRGSYNITMSAVSLLKDIISLMEFGNAAEMCSTVRNVGCFLSRSLPQEAVVGNMVRRVLRIIREEFHLASKQQSSEHLLIPGIATESSGESLQNLVRAKEAARRSMHADQFPDLRSAVLDHITEFQVELETSGDNIASQAPEHVHCNELILTFGASRLVERFLKRAAKVQKFQVIVAEGPDCDASHQLALSLAKARISTTVVADCAVMAVMCRVNKVLLGTQTVLAGGGLRAAAGAHAVALAARHYSVPLIVLAPLYKLCPVHLCSHEQDDFNILASPEVALPYSTGSLVHQTHVYNPLYDYVPPDLVTLFITNSGGNAPSYIYRLISELYHPDDFEL